MSQTGLAEQLGVEQATLSIMLGRMEKAGLVRRRTDPEDARVTRVCATAKGLLRGLTEEDQKMLANLLARLRANVESRRTAHDGRA